MQIKDANVLAARMRAEVGRASCRTGVAGGLVIPKEFERSNLAFELKAGKKRLELVLHGLADEQCGMDRAVPSDSISELISHTLRRGLLSVAQSFGWFLVSRTLKAISSQNE